MPISTRDYQRERRNSRLAAGAFAAITEGIDLFGTDIASLTSTPRSPVHRSRHTSNIILPNNFIRKFEGITTNDNLPKSKRSLFGHYQWKMTHYFYLHLSAYIFNGLFGGLLIILIENYSTPPNPYMKVSYLDAWFTTVSTICSCGLTTIDFAQLSQASQIIMMFFAFISGFAMSTLPALFIKAQTHKTALGTKVDDDHDKYDPESGTESVLSNSRSDQNLPLHIRAQLAKLPSPIQLRYRAYIMCIILIFGLYLTIYTTGFILVGTWLQTHQSERYLMQNNATLSPWYISGSLTLFGFNQNGLAPFSTSLARYVDDVFLNIVFVVVNSLLNCIFTLLQSFCLFLVGNVWFIIFSNYFT